MSSTKKQERVSRVNQICLSATSSGDTAVPPSTRHRELCRRTTLRGLLAVGAATAMCLLSGVGAAHATPPSPHVEQGVGIVVDVPAGEWWSCQGLSLAWPIAANVPGLYQYALGPTQLVFNQFPPGAQVWISCNGSGLPLVYYGPVLTA